MMFTSTNIKLIELMGTIIKENWGAHFANGDLINQLAGRIVTKILQKIMREI